MFQTHKFQHFQIYKLYYIIVYQINLLQDCEGATELEASETRICTGHIARAPTEYTFLVEKGKIEINNRTTKVLDNFYISGS